MPRTTPIRVFIADDHEVVRGGLRAMLETSPDVEVVGEACDGRVAVDAIMTLAPDVALIDVSMKELNGIDTVRLLRRKGCSARLLMLSMHAMREFVSAAIAAGADGYLIKEAPKAEILEAVRTVHAGQRYLSEQIRGLFSGAAGGDVTSAAERLSVRERQVLQLVVEGRSSFEIAEIIHLSPKTVDTYRSRIMKKLGLPDITALVKFAVQHGLTTLS